MVKKKPSKAFKPVGRGKKLIKKLPTNIYEELRKPQFSKEARKQLIKKYGFEKFEVVLNPKYELPQSAKHYFVFIDNEGAIGFLKAKEFVEREHPGCIALYYTVSWSEIVIQFCGTGEELLQYIRSLVNFVKDNTTPSIDFEDKKVIEGFWLEATMFLHGEEVRPPSSLQKEFPGLEKAILDYESGRAQKNSEIYTTLQKRGIILGFSATRDFVKQKRLRSIVLISYNSKDIQPPARVFREPLEQAVIEAYTVKRAQNIGDFNSNPDYDSVQVLAILEHENVFDFRQWMNELYKNVSVNCLPFILASRVKELSRNAAFDTFGSNVVTRFSNADANIPLGKAVKPDGTLSEQSIALKPSQLLGHTIVIGKKGSQKTSAMAHWVKSAAAQGMKIIALDIKGDLIGPTKFSLEQDGAVVMDPKELLESNLGPKWQERFKAPISIVQLQGLPQAAHDSLERILREINGLDDLSEPEKARRDIRYLIVIDEFHFYSKSKAVTSGLLYSTMSISRSKGVGLVLLGQSITQFDLANQNLLEEVQNWFFMCIEPSDTDRMIKKINKQMAGAYQPYNIERDVSKLPPGTAFLVSAPDHVSYNTAKVQFPQMELK